MDKNKKYPKKTVVKTKGSKGNPFTPELIKTKTTVKTQTLPIADVILALPKAPREACQDCTRKHIAQAVILINESLMGYPEHKWLAIGHLAEASEECLGEFPRVAQSIRVDRLSLMSDVTPDLMKYLRDDFAILTNVNQDIQ
jgi:hypothetical protein